MSMRWLCDENIPRMLVRALEQVGQDVVWIGTVAPGSADTAVLDRAIQDRRLLLTFDKDFGELAARSRLPPAVGVVLLRLSLSPREASVDAVAAVLSGRTDWAGHFSVIEAGRLRMRALGQVG